MRDISTFMTWWLNQVIGIITYCYNVLDSLQFGGTSVLRLILTITIIGALFKVTLVIPQQIIPKGERTRHDNKPKRDK